MIRFLASKDYFNFIHFLQDNKYECKHAESLFNKCLKNSSKCILLEEADQIKSILLIIENSDKKKFIKIISTDNKISEFLLRFLSWNYQSKCYLQIKEGSFVSRICQKYQFKYLETKNKELVFYFKPEIKKYREVFAKDRES